MIEIPVVLTRIGVVMGIFGGNNLGQGEKAKRKPAKIEQIGQTLDYFRLEVRHYPTQEGLQTLITAGTYSKLKRSPLEEGYTLPKDAWGNEQRSAEAWTNTLTFFGSCTRCRASIS